MKSVLDGTNLLAGGVAGALLVVLVFALGVPLWLGVVLAVAAFVGVALLAPGGGTATAARADRAALEGSLKQGANEVAEMRRLGARVPSPRAKTRVLAICDSADRVLGALGEDGREPEAARAFVERYLLPSRKLLTQYVRLAGRGVASAGPAIAKIEENDLPLLDRKLRELYEGLHRGDVIDLEVASEMLEFDLAGVEPASPRRLDG